MRRWRASASVSHLRLRRLRLAAFTVLRRFLAAAPTVTPCTIAHTMVTRTQRTVHGTITGPMLTQPTTQCIEFIGPPTLTRTTRGSIDHLCMRRRIGHLTGPLMLTLGTDHLLGLLRTGVHASCACATAIPLNS